MESELLTSIMKKLKKSAALSDQELTELQSHIDQIEQRKLAAHGDTVQSSHFHPGAALGLGSGRESLNRG